MLAQNKIFLTEEVAGKGRFFRARFLQPGLVKYSFGVCLLTKDVIDSFVSGFVGCSVTIDHVDITEDNCDDVCCGTISRVEYNECDGWYWCEGILRNPKAIELVRNGYTVSCQYEITEYADNTTGALHNGIEYDKTILGGRCEHLAIVKNPRYEGAMIAVNAIDKTGGNFVTLKRKDGSIYKAHLIDDSKHVDSFGSYAAYLRVRQTYETLPSTTRELIGQWLDEIKDDVQAEIAEEDRLPQTTKGICSFLSTVVNDKGVVVESVNKYHFIIQRPQRQLSHQQAQRIADSLNGNKSIPMRAMLVPAGDSDSGAGFAVHVEVFKKENNMRAQNANNEEGKWITVKGTHVFVKDGQSIEDAMQQTFSHSAHQDEDHKGVQRQIDEMKGKYDKEDADFDIEKMNEDVKFMRDQGCSLEETAEHLGLDEDEVRETGLFEKSARNSIVNKTKDVLYDVMSRTIVERLKQNGYL